MYIFLHIPKTAGTTFEALLIKNFEEGYVPLYDSTIHDDFNAEEKKAIATFFTEAKCVASHQLSCPLPQPDHVDIRYKPLTFLRKPVDRILSYYRYVGNDPRHLGHLEFDEYFRRTIERDYNRTGGHSSGLCNAQAQTLDPNLDPEKILAQLDSLFFVGLTERFDESLLIFRKKLADEGVSFDIHYLSKKVRGRLSAKQHLPPESYGMVAKHNELDQLAYDYAEKLLDREIEKYGPEFTKDLEQFKREQRRRKPIALAAIFLDKAGRAQQRLIHRLVQRYT